MVLTTENRFKPNLYGKGIYVNLVTITGVEDISGTTPVFLDRPIEIGVKLKLDIGRDFEPELSIFGEFERDANTREVKGWGSAFCIQELLFKLSYKGHLGSNNSIPAEALQSLIGKQFYKLTYVSGIKDNGNLKYSNWYIIASSDEDPESLAKRFHKSVNSGYPRNYRPELVDIQEEILVEETTHQMVY